MTNEYEEAKKTFDDWLSDCEFRVYCGEDNAAKHIQTIQRALTIAAKQGEKDRVIVDALKKIAKPALGGKQRAAMGTASPFTISSTGGGVDGA